jgi:hypothetical protein
LDQSQEDQGLYFDGVALGSCNGEPRTAENGLYWPFRGTTPPEAVENQ